MSNTTTIVRGWKLTRKDATVFAFTDHDRDLAVGGVTYLASSALSPSEAVASLGMAVDEQEVEGGINASVITEADLSAGLYDGARVDVIEIDWTGPTQTATVGRYYLGEVSRTASAFTAELRSLAGVLSQRRGRWIMQACDADLGDTRCGVNTSALTETGAAAIVLGASGFTITGTAAAQTDGWFSGGLLTWTTGANAGRTFEVRAHWGGQIDLWRTPPDAVSPGDGFTIQPGCDKAFETCRAKFSNQARFRGFPTVATEQDLTYASRDDASQDGSSRTSF